MRLATPFTRLLLRVDAAALAAEVAQIEEADWRPHPDGMAGNSALPLLAAHGDPTDDATRGPMQPTPHLARLPYTRQVLAGLGTVIGRSRLMRIAEEAEVTPHVDSSHYWWERVRIHVPVITDPAVQFEIGTSTQHLAPGEVWAVDTWNRHRVVNPAAHKRIHLVVDTVGSPAFWDLVERSRAEPDAEPKDLPNRLGADLAFPTESVNQPTVMTPWELNGTLQEIDAMLRPTAPAAADEIHAGLEPFRRGWRATWARFGDGPDGWPVYAGLREEANRVLLGLEGRHRLPNTLDVVEAIRSLVLRPALDPDLPASELATTRAGGRRARRIQHPVIVVSSPRSGSSLLFETLARSPALHTVGGESHQIIESIPGLAPGERGWASNRLTAADAPPAVVGALHLRFEAGARDRNGARPAPAQPFRLLEKTPKNALRVPFLAEAFPDATFVYLYRDPRETISSMLDAWRSGRFVTYPDLPGWGQPQWSLLLTPGWRELIHRPLADVVAEQWIDTTTTLLDDLEALPPERWCVASYDRLVADPSAEIGQLCEHLGLAWDVELGERLPDARHTLESPHPDKWKKNATELEEVWDRVRPVATRAHGVFADPPRIRPVVPVFNADGAPAPASAAAPDAGGGADRRPMRSVHSRGMAELLHRLGSSLLVSTYQSGRVIVVRPDGDRVNTHFRSFLSPMGMAQSGDLLALGTKQGVWVYQDQPAVGEKLEPKGRHDACFMPRTHHITGDIRIHDIGFAGPELWLVNTRFSCLATLDGRHSFVPQWKPPFITKLAPEDRCHLNGLTLIDDEVRYASALGITDEPGGWRDHKAAGGVLMEVPSGEVVLSGLSMPHSPRWHGGRLWILESGKGTLAVADLDTGTVETVAHLPGFTRGLAFAGPYAFVGLSQVREHVFGGIPLTDDLDQRVCGVWVVDTRSGEVVGFLRFEGAVQEIYDVQVLANRRWPEIAEPDAELVSGSFVLSAQALAQT